MPKPLSPSQARGKLFIISLGIITGVIGVCEMLVMLLLGQLPGWGIQLPMLQEAALDTLCLSLFSTPLLWLFSLRPLAIKIADQAQLKINAELRIALDAHALVSIADSQGRIVHANAEFCKVSGYELDELIGQDQRMVHAHAHDKEFVFNLWRTLQPGDHWKGEFCNRNKQGGHYWVDTTIVPLGDDAGKLKQFISIFRDITAQKENEQKLLALKRGLDASNEMIFITDAQGYIQYANPAFHGLTGWDEADTLGRGPDFLDSPNSDPQTLSELKTQLKQEHVWYGRLLNRRKSLAALGDSANGHETENPEFWADVNITPIQNHEGGIFGYVQVMRDVTPQVAQEEALQITLQNNAARLAIANVLQHPQPIKERFGQVLDILLALKMCGDNYSDAGGKGGVLLRTSEQQYLELLVWRGEFDAAFIRRQHPTPGGPYRCRFVAEADHFCDSPHYTIPIATAGNILGMLFLHGNPNGNPQADSGDMFTQVGEMMALALLQDQAKTALEAARDSALQAAKTKTEFLANMSHEIRTPMNGVLGMLDLLKDTEMSMMQKELLETAANSAESLLDIINDILDFSKLGAGKIELEQVEFNLHTLVEEVCMLLSGRAHAKNLELNCLLPVNLPIRWQGDPTRIRQILTNLIGNAVKFTEQGEISVKVALADDISQAGLRFDIKDTGIGIAPEAQKRLFQAFSQSDNTMARRFGGTGLGLSICKNLLDLMDGDIGIVSELGAGAIFWFTLPILPVAGDSTAPLSNLSGKRALVVDDNATNRKIIQHYLNHWGCLTTEADNGPAALLELETAARRGNPYDFLLCDLHMPEMDGIELIKAINNIPAIAEIPRLLLSSGALDMEHARLRLGIAQILQKPVRQRQLFDAIVNALHLSHRPLSIEPAVSLPNYSGRRILVVEDNKVNQKVILSLLAKFRIDTDLAENGQIGLDKLTAGHGYDLVLMDCQMPIMDGYQATRLLREREQAHDTPRLPVIAVTAHAAWEERGKCQDAGMDDYTSKPLTRAALKAVLQRWLGEPPADAASRNPKEHPPHIPVAGVCWDEAATLKELDGDRELLREMITLFLQEAPVQISRLEAALAHGDLQELADTAHTLKGMAGHFYADTARKLATGLEQHAGNATTADFRFLTEQLKNAMDSLSESLSHCKEMRDAK